jgi:anti-anti-sigma factor
MTFACEVEPDRDRAIVRPVGELDLATVGTVDATIRELVDSGFSWVVLDLSGLTFLDSTGIRLVLEWVQASREDGMRFELIPGSPEVQRPFEIAGLADRLPVVPARPGSSRQWPVEPRG